MKKIFFGIIFIITTIHSYDILPRSAFCQVAIADIVIDRLGNENSNHEQIKNAYHQLPISWGPDLKDKPGCPRAHQLLLHEIVVITHETDYEAYVEIPNCTMIAKDGSIQSVQGWMLKENLCDTADLGIYQALLPDLTSWQDGHLNRQQKNLLSLASPYIDEDGNFYCAGTQFLINSQTSNYYYVAAYDAKINQFKEIGLPQRICSHNSKILPLDVQRELFCSLLSVWANIPNACVPLVWGGASIGKVWDYNDYSLGYRQAQDGQSCAVWERPKYGDSVYMGVDASGVILRIAQIVGIRYFCRNSNTALMMLDTLGNDELPKEGDLLWMPGSLSVINLKQNTIITVMSYTAGYGRLIELPLSTFCKDITTYNDLIDAYRNNKTLTILNHDGSIARVVDEFTLLKLG